MEFQVLEERMIQVDEKETIRRLHFIRRHSIRGISKELHHSRKTVRKALRDASVPEYHLFKARSCPVMDPFKAVIERWLEEDKIQPRKQRHTAHRIYERLVNEHYFTGSERTVRQYVSRLKPKFQEMFIPLEFDPGADAQCDWGEAMVYMGDKLVTVQVLCMKLSYSGKPFVMAFPTQRQEAFFEGQRQAFNWYQGVPVRISYDNLTQAVQKVLRGRNREEQQGFIAFRSHYLFEAHFAMPRHPQEQGRVESLVGYMRRNYFVPVPAVKSFEELNRMLLGRLYEDDRRPAEGKEISIGEAWEREKGKLLPLPRIPYRCCVSRPLKANHLSLVNFDNNRYSVPVEFGIDKLTLQAYVWRVEVACGDRVIASHERCYQKDQDILNIDHYLPLLIQRPGAFPYAKPVRQWKMPEIYREFLSVLSQRLNGSGVREFLQVLALGRSYGQENLEKAMRQALSENMADAERVRQLVNREGYSGIIAATLSIYPSEVKVILPDLSRFDELRLVTVAGGGD
jgi:transposase